MPHLAPKQARVLDFIGRAIADYGRPPTFREIARRLSLSLATVRDHVKALKAKGAISGEPGKARSLIPEGLAGAWTSSLPLLGRVPAGRPSEAVEDLEGRVSVDPAVSKGADYALRVRGDSMAPEMLDGDLILVRQAPEARDGERVVAHVEEGEATVKVLRLKGRQAWLEPLNPAHKPIRARFKVVGKVVGLLRRYTAGGPGRANVPDAIRSGRP